MAQMWAAVFGGTDCPAPANLLGDVSRGESLTLFAGRSLEFRDSGKAAQASGIWRDYGQSGRWADSGEIKTQTLDRSGHGKRP